MKEEARNTPLAATSTRWFLVKLNVCFCCSSKLLVISHKERIDTPLGPYKHKIAASNFVKILTAPKEKHFDQIFRLSQYQTPGQLQTSANQEKQLFQKAA